MRDLLDLYRAFLSIRIAEQLQYRVAAAIWLIEVALSPLISIVVWSAVAQSQGGVVNGYTTSSFASYFIAAMLVNYLTHTWVFWEYEWRIRKGLFSSVLLKPVHPIHGDVANNLAYKLLMLFVIAPVTLLLVLLFHPVFHLNWWYVPLLFVALIQAYIVRFAIEWTLAMVAFWTTRVNVINQLYTALLLFLSGQLVPLAFFPAPVQTAASVLPFRSMVAFPVELALGALSLNDILSGLAVQSVWIVLSVALLIVVWRIGIRRYSAVGA
jgi:ABC-2 type transport system permease protein